MARLDEGWKLSTVGKLALAGMAAWVMGRASKIKLRGTQDEVDAISSALLASRKFHEELLLPGATAESVIDKLSLKTASAHEFERILGVPWPL